MDKIISVWMSPWKWCISQVFNSVPHLWRFHRRGAGRGGGNHKGEVGGEREGCIEGMLYPALTWATMISELLNIGS